MRAHASDDGMEIHLPRLCASRVCSALPRSAEGRSVLLHWLTLFCLGLVLLSGTLQAEHVHQAAAGSVDTHAACSLCVVAHAGVETVAGPLLQTAAVVVGEVQIRLARAAYSAPKNFVLYTRPPPTDPILA